MDALFDKNLYEDFQPKHFNSFDELVEFFGSEPDSDPQQENCRLLMKAIKAEKDTWLEEGVLESVNAPKWAFYNTIYMLSRAYEDYIKDDGYGEVFNKWRKFENFIDTAPWEYDDYHETIDQELELLLGADEPDSPLRWWRKEDFYDEVEDDFEYIRPVEYKGYEYIVAKSVE